MYTTQDRKTKILFVDADDVSFQVRQCIARVLSGLPPVELYHAHNANEALRLLEKHALDVIVIDEELDDECKLVMEYAPQSRVPVLLQSAEGNMEEEQSLNGAVVISKNDSLDGLHYCLLVAIKMALKNMVQHSSVSIH